jgi:transposase
MPLMNPFPAPRSILVMDNAPIHHGGRIEEICAAAGVLLIYLPPYLPDMNPIKKFFLVLKSQLKRQQILTNSDNNPILIKHLVYKLGTPRLMSRLFLGSGYLGE